MNYASLATRYRPQTFAEVTGQEMIKTILSRAAAEDKVAPAYLLSGTRGVGKTTIARIFAKALNCEHAPTPEPCNQCEQCRRIMAGTYVDVLEIDGASNRGVDDARRLREAIAYAPMEGRYKVFIIDEAHMLTRESFNALLKTLEEPPPRVTFILATTEPHKFPITILSRCQHFSFRALTEKELTAHLINVLNKENISFEDNAVRLVARRAAGSVRDAMSLLGQTLALSGDTLTEKAARDVLGLAGQELYERLLTAFKQSDCLEVANLTQELLERRIDLGFFLRELTLLWRNLFLLKQAGVQAAESLNLQPDELQRLQSFAQSFDLLYIHAAWQMVLENQRQILTSLEPATALELLLLNLALLPQLVSIEKLSALTNKSATLPQKVQTVPSMKQNIQVVASQPLVNISQIEVKPEELAQANPQQQADESVPTTKQIDQTEAVNPAGTWREFYAWSLEQFDKNFPIIEFKLCEGTLKESTLFLLVKTTRQYNKLIEEGAHNTLQDMAKNFWGRDITVEIQTESDLKKIMEKEDIVKTLLETFQGSELVHCSREAPVEKAKKKSY